MKIPIQLTPKLQEEFHPTKNESIEVSSLTSGSHKKVWWLGRCGHEWQAEVKSRTQGNGCPYCSSSKVLVGFNDLQTYNPKISKEWNYTKNQLLKPSEVFPNSHKKVWWECDKGHEWQAAPYQRSRGDGCPYCSNKKILVGYNDLATLKPELASEWHPTKNGGLKPSQVGTGINRKSYWWQCGKKHEWKASLGHRSRGVGCPYCSNYKVLVGYNDLATINPELASEWHPTKNNFLTPEETNANSSKKAWWQCNKGHEWEAPVVRRNYAKQGCPYCSNRMIITGYNDMATIHPQLVSEWHPTKNGELLPTLISKASGKNIWWQCNKGHEWQTSLSERGGLNRKSNCPKCAIKTSKAEQTIVSFLEENNIVLEVSNRAVLDGKELDIYVPEKKVAIEYNGLYWHTEKQGKDKYYHYEKWKRCKKQGIQLIQIWEDDWNRNSALMKGLLLKKLKLSQQPTVFARKTYPSELSRNEAQKFLQQNHIQGFSSGSYYIGLKKLEDNNEVVAVIVLKKVSKSESTLDIIRYATNTNVPGGFTKLLAYIKRTLKPSSLITFSDNMVSDGSLYRNNGFIAVKELGPDYMYVVKGERKHKFNYRIKRFRNDPELQYVEGYTEAQLAQLNNLHRIWDAGKTKWELSFAQN